MHGRPIAIGGARQRTILALLLLNPGKIVSVETLIETVWKGHPPATARTQVAICIAALRKRFKAEGCDGEVIVTAHPGYLLALDDHSVDAVEFEQFTSAAQEALEQGSVVDAAHAYEQALALWRGPALAGVAGALVEDEAARLEELRLATYDTYVAAKLELGHHRELIPDLVTVVRDHPLRERSRGALMLAQYRAGRRAEAMETFREGWAHFIEDLGLEPGPELQRLHDAILRDDPSLEPPATAARAMPKDRQTPLELPADVPAFSGREWQLGALDRLVDGRGGQRSIAAALITGSAGVGKTGLALHWSHRVAGRFPDGLLYADMSGHDENRPPVSSEAVLGRFLQSLGVPEADVPDGVHERIALYRSLMADRKVLIVLDDVRTFDQIRALIPGSPCCCVVVTSRCQLEQLVVRHGALRIDLDALTRQEATGLLERIIGEERVRFARADADRLVELCDSLPLTVRIAAAKLTAKPHWSVGYLVSRLANEQQRLDELSAGESRLRSSFELSYRSLTPQAAELYQRLGLLETTDFAGWVGAALLDEDVDMAESLMEQLVDAQLLHTMGFDATGRPRYRFRTLSRLYAREAAHREGDVLEQREALGRAFRTWLTIASHARRRERGHHGGRHHGSVLQRTLGTDVLDQLTASASEWFAAERLALISVIDQAAWCGMDELSRDLSALLVTPMESSCTG
ncbi:AfsR/SARP family transcriptional regulator [Streptomyces sp. CB02923]|uniref:AfsR/SARP family transcriptional regulator n=1 Tax=Streptomyces sp. CB02923 TaxID=1718985 RepID=UPI001F5B4996|nr:AfsR/SARP family transcriptional regulator [Streptomyces sp. CB02923]